MHLRTVRHTPPIAVCVAVLAAALVTGCGDDDESESVATPPAAPANFMIEATAEGKRKAISFPATIEAGLVKMTLKNSDSVARSAWITRLTGNHTVDDFLKVLEERDGPIPSWIQDGGGVPTVEPGATVSVTQVLAPGRYAIIDDPANTDLGAKGEFTVTGTASDAELPAQPATLTATDDGKDSYGFEFDGLQAGTNNVRFENTGRELHHAIIFPIKQGKTIADAEEVLSAEEEPKGPPPVDFENVLGTQVIDGGVAQNIELDLKAGRYAVVCFIQDRKGGKPHIAQGMIDELTIE